MREAGMGREGGLAFLKSGHWPTSLNNPIGAKEN